MKEELFNKFGENIKYLDPKPKKVYKASELRAKQNESMKRTEFEDLKNDAALEIAKRIYGKDLSFEETQTKIKAEIELIFSNYLVGVE